MHLERTRKRSGTHRRTSEHVKRVEVKLTWGAQNRGARAHLRWTRVSAGDIEVYAPCNAPSKALCIANRIFTFGRVESGDEAIAPSVAGDRAGDGDGNRRDGDGG